MPTLGELASKGQLHRVARFLRQELTPLDFERTPEAFEARLEDLLAQAIEIASGNQSPKEKSSKTPAPVLPERPYSSEVIAERPKSSGKSPLFRWVAESVASQRHPERNEDQWLVAPEANLAAVLDGVGGSAAAAEASTWVTQTLKKEIDDMVESGETVTDWPAALKQLIQTLNTQFLTAAKEDKQLAGGATTIAIATVLAAPSTQEELVPSHSAIPFRELKLAYAVVGDSRVSIWHKTDNKYELTVLDDHLLRLLLAPADRRPNWLKPLLIKHGLPADLTLDANRAAKLATILDQDPNPARHDEIAKFLFAERSIVTQVLGTPSISPHTGMLKVASGDRILFATDGIHDNLTEQELITILANTKFDEVASALVLRASEVAKSGAPRAKPDDMTAIVLEIL